MWAGIIQQQSWWLTLEDNLFQGLLKESLRTWWLLNWLVINCSSFKMVVVTYPLIKAQHLIKLSVEVTQCLPSTWLSFLQLICSYIFMPVTFMMGISWEDSFLAAELIGTKLFLNEFVAYEKLSAFKRNRFNGLEEYINGQKQWVSVSNKLFLLSNCYGLKKYSWIKCFLK